MDDNEVAPLVNELRTLKLPGHADNPIDLESVVFQLGGARYRLQRLPDAPPLPTNPTALPTNQDDLPTNRMGK